MGGQLLWQQKGGPSSKAYNGLLPSYHGVCLRGGTTNDGDILTELVLVKHYVDNGRSIQSVFPPGTLFCNESKKFTKREKQLAINVANSTDLVERTQKELHRCLNSLSEHFNFTTEDFTDFNNY